MVKPVSTDRDRSDSRQCDRSPVRHIEAIAQRGTSHWLIEEVA